MIILDTCALLWLVQGSDRLSVNARNRIDAEAVVSVSAVSAFEIALKHRTGKLHLPIPAGEWWKQVIAHHNLDVLAIDDEVALGAALLPPIHRDPADRFIIATAKRNFAPVATADDRFAAYGVHVIS